MRRLISTLLALGVAAAVALVVTGDDDDYTIKMHLANAGGLRDGSPVINGGVPIGTVGLRARRDDVEVALRIDKRYAPVGKDAVAGIVAQNLLGQKQVRVQPGDRDDPAPPGFVLPARQVHETTDLDQLLNTLDPDTRTRLAIVIDEMGTAFARRKLDFAAFLRDAAPTLSSGAEVLGQLTADNRALTQLVDTSDRFVAELAVQRRRISRVVDAAGAAAETVALKRGELRATLARAPGALRQARRFLVQLRGAAAPLGQTARLVTRTSPSLQRLLEQLEPFQRDAGPTVRAAASLGPIAHRTATRAAPTVARLTPTADALRALAQRDIPPVGAVLDRSADNLLATIDNWAHAIQFRDGLGHIFRGEASIAPDLWDSIVNRLVPANERRKLRRKHRKESRPASPEPTVAPGDRSIRPPHLPLPPKVKEVVDEALAPVKKLLGPATGDTPKDDDTMSQLLDFLLGDDR